MKIFCELFEPCFGHVGFRKHTHVDNITTVAPEKHLSPHVGIYIFDFLRVLIVTSDIITRVHYPEIFHLS